MIRNLMVAGILTISAVAADTSLISLAPANAKMIGGIHVDRTANSQFGQFVLSQMRDGDGDLQEFISASGFDPRRDVRDLVVASTGERKGPAVVIARGVFNGPQLLNAIQAKQGGTFTNYKGVNILDKNDHSVAVTDGSLAIAGQAAMVRAALDRRSVTGTPGPLATKAATASNRFDAWMVTEGIFVAPLPSTGNTGPTILQGPGLQGIVETSGGLTFGSLIQFSAEALTRSDKDAQALVDVVRFLASMLQMNAGRGPEMQVLQPLFNSLDVKAEGTTVRMSFSLPEADLERLLEQRAKPGTRVAHRH